MCINTNTQHTKCSFGIPVSPKIFLKIHLNFILFFALLFSVCSLRDTFDSVKPIPSIPSWILIQLRALGNLFLSKLLNGRKRPEMHRLLFFMIIILKYIRNHSIKKFLMVSPSQYYFDSIFF